MSIFIRFLLKRPGFRLDVRLDLPGEGVTAITGPSGCGKTTLLRCIAGLEKPHEGCCRIGNATWQDSGIFLPCHVRDVGYVFQEADLFPHLSVRGNLEYGWKRVQESKRQVSLEEVSAMLGLQQLLGRTPAELSGGERQRAAIARAILTSPRLLIMDEPLASLDQEAKARIINYLEKIFSSLSMPIIYVSHQQDEIERLTNRIVRMKAGIATFPEAE